MNMLAQLGNTEQSNALVEVVKRQFNGEQTSEPMTDSFIVASHFEKQHKNVIRAIETCQCSKEFAERNFELCFKNNDLQNGKPQKFYRMTKNGFSFIAMGFTGKQAAQFKESYINAFDEMSNFINSQNLTLIAQFNKAFLEFERASDIASQAGRNLSLYGRKIKPMAAERVAELERQIQPLLFTEDMA